MQDIYCTLNGDQKSYSISLWRKYLALKRNWYCDIFIVFFKWQKKKILKKWIEPIKTAINIFVFAQRDIFNIYFKLNSTNSKNMYII